MAENYIPTSNRGREYRTMGYWYALGHQDGQQDDKASDICWEFGVFCAQLADNYDAGKTSSMSCIPDMFMEYNQPETEFRVTWEIDMGGRTPTDVARKVQTLQREGKWVGCFTVYHPDGTITEVDLDQHDQEGT